MYLIGFRASIADEKEIHHWICVLVPSHTARPVDGLLFFISSSGVPRHWTTSVNNGDTVDISMRMSCMKLSQRFSLSLPIVILATIFFRTVLRFRYFLSFASAAWSSVRNSWMMQTLVFILHVLTTTGGRPHLDFSALEEFRILTMLTTHPCPREAMLFPEEPVA